MMKVEDVEDKLREWSKNFIDLEFPPNDSSVFDLSASSKDRPFDVYVHWRRPVDFMKADIQLGLIEPSVFYESIEPNDLKKGVLANHWLVSALAILAERYPLIERLFITKEYKAKVGIY